MYLVVASIFAVVALNVNLQHATGQGFNILPPEGCDCHVTGQYNVVCGTDGNNYKTPELLNCYKRCQNGDLAIQKLGKCGSKWRGP